MVKSFNSSRVENSFTQPNASISEKNVGMGIGRNEKERQAIC